MTKAELQNQVEALRAELDKMRGLAEGRLADLAEVSAERNALHGELQRACTERDALRAQLDKSFAARRDDFKLRMAEAKAEAMRTGRSVKV